MYAIALIFPQKQLTIVISFAIILNCAGVAQLVELLICNQPVAGSSPVTSFFIGCDSFQVKFYNETIGLSEDPGILCELGVETYGVWERYPAIGLSQCSN